jgi:hypothetical protein
MKVSLLIEGCTGSESGTSFDLGSGGTEINERRSGDSRKKQVGSRAGLRCWNGQGGCGGIRYVASRGESAELVFFCVSDAQKWHVSDVLLGEAIQVSGNSKGIHMCVGNPPWLCSHR